MSSPPSTRDPPVDPLPREWAREGQPTWRPARAVVYVSMAPRHWADDAALLRRQEAFANCEPCTHWPFTVERCTSNLNPGPIREQVGGGGGEGNHSWSVPAPSPSQFSQPRGLLACNPRWTPPPVAPTPTCRPAGAHDPGGSRVDRVHRCTDREREAQDGWRRAAAATARLTLSTAPGVRRRGVLQRTQHDGKRAATPWRRACRYRAASLPRLPCRPITATTTRSAMTCPQHRGSTAPARRTSRSGGWTRPGSAQNTRPRDAAAPSHRPAAVPWVGNTG